MATKHAKTLDQLMFAKLLNRVSEGEHSIRDQTILLLSYKAGLRSQEIAGLEWTDVCDAEGRVRSDSIFIPGDIAKRGLERTVPMHPHLQTTLIQLREMRPKDHHVIYPTKPGLKKMSANAITVWFHRLYEKNNFEGCSSHSGRRTYITSLARKAGTYECSIRDVQMLAGHRNLGTTESYIDLSPHVGRLVSAI